jgi:hypothetical protein
MRREPRPILPRQSSSASDHRLLRGCAAHFFGSHTLLDAGRLPAACLKGLARLADLSEHS